MSDQDRLIDIMSSVREVQDVSHDMNREIGEIQARIASAEEMIRGIKKLLCDDGGAVLPRVSVLEREIILLRTDIADLDRRKKSGDLPPMKDHHGEMASVEIEQTKVRWAAIKALVPGVAKALAAGGLGAAAVKLIDMVREAMK